MGGVVYMLLLSDSRGLLSKEGNGLIGRYVKLWAMADVHIY